MSELKNIALSFQCKESWESMTLCDGGKFCNVCKKTVYDFSNFSKEEYDNFINSQTDAFCANYKTEQTIYHSSKSFSFKKWAYGLLVILGLTSCEENSADNSLQKKNDARLNYQTRGVPVMPTTDLEVAEKKKDNIMGKAMVAREEEENHIDCFRVPEYKYGGEEGMIAFFHKNLSIKDSVFGTVRVNFIIDKKGKVIESRITKSLSPENDKEVLRVANLLEFEESDDTISYELPVVIDGEL